MGIFEHRLMQRYIDESKHYATETTRRTWVSKLNSSSSPAYVATEWEIVILKALSGLGVLRHEPDLGGPARADVVLETPQINFCADITGISDYSYYKSNPFKKLEEEIKRRYESSRIEAGGITFDIIDLRLPPAKGRKQRNLLPTAHEFPSKIFTSSFYAFLEEAKRSPAERRSFSVALREFSSMIRLFYIPGTNGVTRTSYNRPQTTTLEGNPLCNALRDKAAQLKRSAFNGIKGVIVCDAGAEVLRLDFSGQVYSARDVVGFFFSKHQSIDFVTILALRNAGDHTIRQRVDCQTYVAEPHPWQANLERILAEMANQLPDVIQTPENAISELKYWEGKQNYRTHLGAGMSIKYGSMAAKEIRMSASALVELLAGRIKQDAFLQRFGVAKGRNIFEQQLRAGCALESAIVVRSADEDKDEIVLRFTDPDPAAFEFVVR